MARTPLTVTTLEGTYGDYGVGEADITMAAADTVNLNDFDLEAGDILIVHNTDGVARGITINSVADTPYGRTGDITAYVLGAGAYATFGPFKNNGWRQFTTGKLHLAANSAGVKTGVLRQPVGE